jgi:hypothetical protein
MPTAMTFTSLVADMQSYLERGTPLDVQVANQIPRLINLAERAIATAMKVQGFITPVTSELTAGTSVYAKPNGWRQTVSMLYGVSDDPTINQNERRPMFARSYEYCRAYWPDSAVMDLTLIKQPQFYSDYDFNHWLIVPTPAINYPWEIIYYTQPALLDQNNQTNWLTDYAPNLLLYRSLLEATPYLKNDERIPVWQQLYTEQLQSIDQQDLQRVADRQSVRNKA